MSRTRTASRLCGMISVALLATGALLAQTTMMSGHVVGTDGNPVEGAKILIDRTDIKGHWEVKTKKKGDWVYAGLPLGATFKVSVEIDGKVVLWQEGVRTRLSDPTEVNFNLKDEAARQKAMQAAALAGGLSDEQKKQLPPEQLKEIERQMKAQAETMKKNKELNESFQGGLAAFQAKDFPTAVAQFTKASEIDPKQEPVWTNLAEAYKGLSKTQTGAEKAASLDSSVAAYAKAIELKPDQAALHNNLGLVLVEQRKFQEAGDELSKAAALDPTNAGKYYFNLGAVLTNIGQLDPAGEAFKKAIEADPNHADAQYQYGIYLISKAQTTDTGAVIPAPGTREAFQKYLDLQPNGPYAAEAKGMLATLDATVDTKYQSPEAAKKNSKSKSKGK